MYYKVGSVFKGKTAQKYSYPMRHFWLIFKYCEDEEVCKNEKSLKMMQFSNPFLFLQKWVLRSEESLMVLAIIKIAICGLTPSSFTWRF